jgi:hypothetical protein
MRGLGVQSVWYPLKPPTPKSVYLNPDELSKSKTGSKKPKSSRDLTHDFAPVLQRLGGWMLILDEWIRGTPRRGHAGLAYTQLVLFGPFISHARHAQVRSRHLGAWKLHHAKGDPFSGSNGVVHASSDTVCCDAGSNRATRSLPGRARDRPWRWQRPWDRSGSEWTS